MHQRLLGVMVRIVVPAAGPQQNCAANSYCPHIPGRAIHAVHAVQRMTKFKDGSCCMLLQVCDNSWLKWFISCFSATSTHLKPLQRMRSLHPGIKANRHRKNSTTAALTVRSKNKSVSISDCFIRFTAFHQHSPASQVLSDVISLLLCFASCLWHFRFCLVLKKPNARAPVTGKVPMFFSFAPVFRSDLLTNFLEASHSVQVLETCDKVLLGAALERLTAIPLPIFHYAN